MVQGNFVIGDLKNSTLKNVETSYKPAVMADVKKDEGPQHDNKMHLNVSVNLGSHSSNMISETKEMYEAKTT